MLQTYWSHCHKFYSKSVCLLQNLKKLCWIFLPISKNQFKTILIEIWKWHLEHSLLWKGWKICFSIFWEFCSPLVECKENLQGKYLIILYYSIMFCQVAEWYILSLVVYTEVVQSVMKPKYARIAWKANILLFVQVLQ